MAKKKTQNQGLDLLTPIDVTKLGTELDPCFGKHYDLTTEECRRCGDSELCAIAMGKKLNVIRTKVESEGRFKDMEEPDTMTIKKYIKLKKKKGLTKIKIIRLTKKKFGISKELARDIYKSIK